MSSPDKPIELVVEDEPVLTDALARALAELVRSVLDERQRQLQEDVA